jgi:hypothetical protein
LNLQKRRSSLRLLLVAALISALYLVCELAGLREMTAVVSGAVPDAGSNREVAVLLGAIYAASYLAFVLLAPPLALAAVLLALWDGIGRRRERRLGAQGNAAS